MLLLREPEKSTVPTLPSNTATGVAAPDIPKDPPAVAVNKALPNKAPVTATTRQLAQETAKPEATNKVTRNASKETPAVPQKEIPPVVADKPVEIPKKAASIPTKPADSDVPDYGTLSWEGTLEPGATLTCSGDRPSSGSIRGLQLLGVPVKLTVVSPGGIEILQAPSAANRWTGFALRNTTSAPLYRIRLRWDTVR